MVALFVGKQRLNMSEKKSVTFDRSPKKDKYESVEMPSRFGGSGKRTVNIPGFGEIDRDKLSVEMPSRVGDSNKKTINLPGFGEVERDKIKALKSGGKVSSASKRADGCAVKGKTKGRMV
jgi:hypothetical protein